MKKEIHVNINGEIIYIGLYTIVTIFNEYKIHLLQLCFQSIITIKVII